MKKVLVTGAAGTIGLHVIKNLLSEGKYEITALDLKNKRSINRLKRFKRRINILYGDVCDRVLIEALAKDHDFIIHLASSIPPLADMKKGLAKMIDFDGTENIIRAISYYNPKCHLFYASTTALYKKKTNSSVKSPIIIDEFDYYNEAKYAAENLIKEKIQNYTVYRLPLVLSDLRNEPFMYHGCKEDEMEVITKEEAGYAFVRGLKYAKDLNKKIFNVTGEERIIYGDLLKKILEIHGLSFKYVTTRLFIEKNFYSSTCKDKDDLNNIIDYRFDSLANYFNRLRGRSNKRKLNRTLAKPLLGGK